MSKFSVLVPASTANIGPGFDTFGCALNLYLEIKVEFQNNLSHTNISCVTNCSQYNHYHFIFRCIYYFYQRLILQIDKQKANINSFDSDINQLSIPLYFTLNIINQIPVASGLGSSASGIIAAIVICNELFGLNLSKNQLFEFAIELEPHPDNIGASLFGSLFVPMQNDDKSWNYSLVKINPNIKFLCITPDIQLSTKFSRNILPSKYESANVVYNIQHSCSLLLSLISETIDVDMISKSLNDKLHQPFRIPYVPGLDEVLQSITSYNTPGLLGIVLSGSGPSILALCYDNFIQINDKITNILSKHNLECKSLLLNQDCIGTNIIYN